MLRQLQKENLLKTNLQIVDIEILNTIQKISKVKLKKDPLTFEKVKNIYEEVSRKNFIDNKLIKNGQSNSTFNFKFSNLENKFKKTPSSL